MQLRKTVHGLGEGEPVSQLKTIPTLSSKGFSKSNADCLLLTTASAPVPVKQVHFDQSKVFLEKVFYMLDRIFTDRQLTPRKPLSFRVTQDWCSLFLGLTIYNVVPVYDVPAEDIKADHLQKMTAHWISRPIRVNLDDSRTEGLSESTSLSFSTAPSDNDPSTTAGNPLPTPSPIPGPSATAHGSESFHLPLTGNDVVTSPEDRPGSFLFIPTAGEDVTLLNDSGNGALSFDLENPLQDPASIRPVIPVDLLPKPDLGPPSDEKKRDPFYERLIWGLVFTFQHPYGIRDDSNQFDPAETIGRYKEVIEAGRGSRRDYAKDRGSLFRTMCAAYNDKMGEIPVFVGHSAWIMNTDREPEPDEKDAGKAFRQCLRSLILLTAEQMKGLEKHEVDQCAEHLALPLAVRAAKRYLEEGKGRTVTITVLAQQFRKNIIVEKAFCRNCQNQAKEYTQKALGLRIVDQVAVKLGEDKGVYESEETVSLRHDTYLHWTLTIALFHCRRNCLSELLE